jgi:hypothetical protein
VLSSSRESRARVNVARELHHRVIVGAVKLKGEREELKGERERNKSLKNTLTGLEVELDTTKRELSITRGENATQTSWMEQMTTAHEATVDQLKKVRGIVRMFAAGNSADAHVIVASDPSLVAVDE